MPNQDDTKARVVREIRELLARGENEVAANKGHSLASVLGEAQRLLARRRSSSRPRK